MWSLQLLPVFLMMQRSCIGNPLYHSSMCLNARYYYSKELINLKLFMLIHHHHHHQFFLSVWRVGLEIMLLQDTLFAAAKLQSCHNSRVETHCHSFSTFLQVFLSYVSLPVPMSEQLVGGSCCPCTACALSMSTGPFPNQFADGLSVGPPGHFFIGHAHWPIDLNFKAYESTCAERYQIWPHRPWSSTMIHNHTATQLLHLI